MTRYLALGDSMSIDKYTNRVGGGAASQFARLLGATAFHNATADGATTDGVLKMLEGPEEWRSTAYYDVITLTIGGNDLLKTALAEKPPVDNAAWRLLGSTAALTFERILEHLMRLSAPKGKIVVNTVYDPTDGDDARLVEIGLPAGARAGLEAYNDDVRMRSTTMLCGDRSIILCDAHHLFKGHSQWSSEPWLTSYIEPNLAGATALAEAWHRLVASR
ncbi:MAG: SGNH/GDSL hydrolase family protein [Patescibacteria group bacterium]|nr:MAG: SGNH/GDSL hydrolase family protein [Patescibacteria group bacterium]